MTMSDLPADQNKPPLLQGLVAHPYLCDLIRTDFLLVAKLVLAQMFSATPAFSLTSNT